MRVEILYDAIRRVLAAYPEASLLDVVRCLAIAAEEASGDREGALPTSAAVFAAGLRANLGAMARRTGLLPPRATCSACGATTLAPGHVRTFDACYLCDDAGFEPQALYDRLPSITFAYESIHAGACAPF